MHRLTFRIAVTAIVLASLALTTSVSRACSVPVYRYALERWPSDPYRVVVFHRGELPKDHKKLVEDLGPYGLAGEKHANLVVKTVDLAGQPDADMLKLWKSQRNAKLPWMVVRYPGIVNYGPAWSGPLSKEAVTTLIDSPARKTIAKRILAGQTAIWVLLESGDKSADEQAYQTLKKQLAIEEQSLKLPAIDDADLIDGDAKSAVSKLRIEFSIVRVSRKDPKERMFAEMLLGSEGSGKDSLRDKEFVNKTMAFPIFGRGRIRYGLVGSGIAADTIHEACAYLVGPCKCQIKQGVENRGMDLVTAVDWKRLVLSTIKDKPAPALQGIGDLRPLPIDTKSVVKQPVAAAKPQRRVPLSAPKPATRHTPIAAHGSEPKSDAETSGDIAEERALSKKTESATESKTPASPSGGSLYLNVFLIFGLVAIVVVGGSLFLARRNA